jgi:hypothetical protein
LLKKSEKEKFKIKFVMISETKEFMKSIKKVFISASMLRHYELDDESMMKTNVFDFVITKIFSQLAEIDDQWRSIVFYFKKMIFVERNYDVNNQKMLVIVKICKKWRHYIKDVKYSVRMMIDHVNLKNFFINKTFNRRKIRWWKRLTELDLKIKYRFDKNNFANDSSRKRDYENETANEDKNNENLNLRKWILIESKNIFTSKNEKEKRTYFFQSTSHQQLALSKTNNNRSKTLKTIDEKSKSNCFANNNLEISAKISIAKNAQNFLKKKNRCDCEKNFEEKKIFQVIVSRHRENFEKASTRKRREWRKSCFEKLNKKCLEQKNDVQRFVLETSHRIIYFATIWFVRATSTISCRKSIDEAWQRERKRETSWFEKWQRRRVEQ